MTDWSFIRLSEYSGLFPCGEFPTYFVRVRASTSPTRIVVPLIRHLLAGISSDNETIRFVRMQTV